MPRQFRLEGDDEKLVDDVRLILKDDNGNTPGTLPAIRMCLKMVRDQGYQLNGADVRKLMEF